MGNVHRKKKRAAPLLNFITKEAGAVLGFIFTGADGFSKNVEYNFVYFLDRPN